MKLYIRKVANGYVVHPNNVYPPSNEERVVLTTGRSRGDIEIDLLHAVETTFQLVESQEEETE